MILATFVTRKTTSSYTNALLREKNFIATKKIVLESQMLCIVLPTLLLRKDNQSFRIKKYTTQFGSLWLGLKLGFCISNLDRLRKSGLVVSEVLLELRIYLTFTNSIRFWVRDSLVLSILRAALQLTSKLQLRQLIKKKCIQLILCSIGERLKCWRCATIKI